MSTMDRAHGRENPPAKNRHHSHWTTMFEIDRMWPAVVFLFCHKLHLFLLWCIFIYFLNIFYLMCFPGAPYEAFSAAMARFMHTLMSTGTLSHSLQVICPQDQLLCWFFDLDVLFLTFCCFLPSSLMSELSRTNHRTFSIFLVEVCCR